MDGNEMDGNSGDFFQWQTFESKFQHRDNENLKLGGCKKSLSRPVHQGTLSFVGISLRHLRASQQCDKRAANFGIWNNPVAGAAPPMWPVLEA